MHIEVDKEEVQEAITQAAMQKLQPKIVDELAREVVPTMARALTESMVEIGTRLVFEVRAGERYLGTEGEARLRDRIRRRLRGETTAELADKDLSERVRKAEEEAATVERTNIIAYLRKYAIADDPVLAETIIEQLQKGAHLEEYDDMRPTPEIFAPIPATEPQAPTGSLGGF